MIDSSEKSPHDVAEDHTYFVGKSMLLSRDVTFAEPINHAIPGWPGK